MLEKQGGSQFSLMFLFSKGDINLLKTQALFSCLPIEHAPRGLGVGGVPWLASK